MRYKEFLVRVLLQKTDVDTVAMEDIDAASTYAWSIGIKPWWCAEEPQQSQVPAKAASAAL